MAAAALIAASAAGVQPVDAAPSPGYTVQQRWKVGGPGGWDYLAVDPAAGRLYVSRSDRVVVLDSRTGKVVGEIAHTEGVHGIALAPKLGRGYTSNGKANSVTVFDLKTLEPIKDIAIDGRNPDAILYDDASGQVFTFNGRSANASVIDAASGKLAGTIALSGKPEFAVSDGHGRIFVNIEDRGDLTVIDAASRTAKVTWKLADCEDPTGLAIDVAHHRLFSVCQNQAMVVTDSADGRQVARVAIGKGPDGAAFDPQRGLAFSSNGEGTLTVVHEDDPEHFSVVENVPTQRSARTLALDATTGRLFLSAAGFGPAPAATAEQARPRPPMLADSFVILVVGR
jgi:DNA-binding beta-propeller fold protein YncE